MVDRFPGILTWSQVEEAETETTEASPPECAIQIQNKGNQQLEKILHEYIDNDEHNLNTLQMTLQGQIGKIFFTKSLLKKLIFFWYNDELRLTKFVGFRFACEWGSSYVYKSFPEWRI